MPDQLKPGGLGSSTDAAARPAAFLNSMADGIERELNALLQAEGHPPLVVDNSADSRDRRLLFVAIARGVVAHLDAHADAFRVTGLAAGTGAPKIEIDVS